VLAYFHSQHPHQSWLAALTAILDTCALVMAGVNDGPTRQAMLADAGVTLQEGVAAEQHLCESRQMYEPYVQALSAYLLMALPPWVRVTILPDRWQTSAWEKLITERATPTHPRDTLMGSVAKTERHG
jgi:hypothetical protein